MAAKGHEFSSTDAAMRALQAMLFALQTVNLGLATRTKLQAAIGRISQEECSNKVDVLHCHLSQILFVCYHMTMTYYPLSGCNRLSGPCKPPINYFDNQFTLQIGNLMAGIPPVVVLQASLYTTLPILFLDWRYAILNEVIASRQIRLSVQIWAYFCSRGLVLISVKILLPLLPMALQTNNISYQHRAIVIYVLAAPVLFFELAWTAIRLLNGQGSASLWELWLVSLASYSIGSCDLGPLIDTLQTQLQQRGEVMQNLQGLVSGLFPTHVASALAERKSFVKESDSLNLKTQAEPLDVDARDRLSPFATAVCSKAESFAKPSQVDNRVVKARRLSWHLGSETSTIHQGSSSLTGHSTAANDAPPTVICQEPSFRRLKTSDLDQLTNLSRVGSSEILVADTHPHAFILFADVCGFTTICASASPDLVVRMLNGLWQRADSIIDRASSCLYKVDTLGDCIMVASGLNFHKDSTPALSIIRFAKTLLRAASKVSSPVTGLPLQMRCGIHSGSVMGALLGNRQYKYSVFGDSVNVASRLESTGRPGAIHISDEVYRELIAQQIVFCQADTSVLSQPSLGATSDEVPSTDGSEPSAVDLALPIGWQKVGEVQIKGRDPLITWICQVIPPAS